MDLVKNGEQLGEEYVGYNVGWVAVAVRCHTVVRGVYLAARLREEVCHLDYSEVFVSLNPTSHRVLLKKTVSKRQTL